MKITAEIKDGKMIFDYEISEVSKQHSEMELTAEGLVCFVSLLKEGLQAFVYNRKKEWDGLLSEVAAKEYISKHPDIIEKIKKQEVR